MTTYGRSNLIKAQILASVPLVLPFSIMLLMLVGTLVWFASEVEAINWQLLQSRLMTGASIAIYLAFISTVVALPLVTVTASLSNRWFRRGRILAHTIASVPPLLLLPLAVLLIKGLGVGSFETTLLILVIVNGSWFAHYSLNRMAVSRQITWQTLQGLGATRWQIIWHVYLRQVLHHTLDLMPFLTSRILGQVLIIGILAPQWQFLPAQLWLGWTAATSPSPLGTAALEIIILLLVSLLVNYLAAKLSTRHWERFANPNHFPMIWSEKDV